MRFQKIGMRLKNVRSKKRAFGCEQGLNDLLLYTIDNVSLRSDCQLTQRCRATSDDAQWREYERTFSMFIKVLSFIRDTGVTPGWHLIKNCWPVHLVREVELFTQVFNRISIGVKSYLRKYARGVTNKKYDYSNIYKCEYQLIHSSCRSLHSAEPSHFLKS